MAWWGYDPEDSTSTFQAAIDSGASEIHVPNMGEERPWIISRTLQLACNQTIIFESGAVVEAKENSFKGRGDCLFKAEARDNLTLIGYGAVLKIRKSDYQSNEYEAAEWRHCLSFLSCSQVIVEGLTILSE